ncbi:E3 ubiquitin-protein ligase-like [Triplophysa rosa]
MFSEAECGICYQTSPARGVPVSSAANTHFVKDACLVTLARAAESPEPATLCPLCRHFTSLSEATIKEKLPVDEDILERLVKAGCFDECADEDEEPNEDLSNQRKEESLLRQHREDA